jgi:hypothetical protein
MSMRLADLASCFQGVIPCVISTCSRAGEPNVTYLSQVHLLDERHVALSRQFFNKTVRNILENPHARVFLDDPLTFDAWRLRLRFVRAETSGPVFETMRLRIDVIASHTGMAGIFRLLSADVFEVLALERVEGYLLPPDPVLDAAPQALLPGPLTEVRGLQVVSDRIARACDLEPLLGGSLSALEELFGFAHSMVLVPDDSGARLVAIASRGYGEQGIGAEVALGEGLIGTVAREGRVLRVAGMGGEMSYGRAIRSRVAEGGGAAGLAPEIPLPGLQDAEAQLALPLFVGGRLVGVLAVESRDPLCFDEWDEAYLKILGNQIAAGMARMEDSAGEEQPGPRTRRRAERPTPAERAGKRRKFVLYKNDDCVFVDGEYLVRNVPGRILWRLLRERERTGQCEFTNRELRLDPWLELPRVKDNLESRLILLRKRLQEKCADVRLVPVRRGRFALELDCAVELTERETA